MKRYHQGEVLWHQGDPSRFVVHLLKGQLEIVGTTEEGEELVHRRVEAGEWLGEMSALDGGVHSATVIAARDCEVEVITTEQFAQKLRQEPELAVRLLKQQNDRLRLLTERRLESAYSPIRTRLARLLLRHLEQEPELVRTHEQLGRELGTTRESVTKALKQLAKAGAITLHRGKVRLADLTNLEGCAQ